MKHLFLKTLAIGLILLAMPMKQQAQQPVVSHNETTISFDITEIDLFDQRVYFLYNLVNDNRFDVVNSEQDGVFIISADPSYDGMSLQNAFAEFKEQNAKSFSIMDKETASETAIALKSLLPKEWMMSMMTDIYIQWRQNNLCASADPFCTDNGMYQFPAGVNAGSGEGGPSYGCLSTRPNPAWYYMRIANPGAMTINMYSTPSHDIDFCCWGPFDDPVSPCPNGLTSAKIVSCSYSTAGNENCHIPSSAQTGEYYILVITNYSNAACNISFSKTGGSGTTDCSILPPLVSNSGPYCVGQTITLTGNAQSGATYSWSGPGGWTATGQTVTRPNCTLAMSGDYTCTIHVGNQSNSAVTPVQVHALAIANFNYTTVCQGNPTQFTSTSTTNPSGQQIRSYQWNFGDGQTGTGQNVSHTYANPGSYPVTLTVSTGGSCTAQKTQNVNVYAVPTANAGEDQTVIYDGVAQLHGAAGQPGTFNYHWEPANKVVNPNAQNTATVPLQQSTTFTLTVTHPEGGCSSTDQVSVLVEGSNMTATASASPNSICQGESSQLNAQAVGGNANAYSYSWSPTIGLSDPNIANPMATPATTTTYTCHVSDGLSSQDVQTTVTVHQPEFEEMEQWICPGESFTFYGEDYSDEGDYPYHTTTAQGCEKVITLHLHHYEDYPYAHTTTEYICPGTSYNFHGHYYNTAGTYHENLHTVHGCDSIVWLELHVYQPNDTIIVDPTICTSQTYNFHGVEYNQDGDVAYFDTIDSHGCLLVEKLELSVGPYQMPPKEEPRICVPYDETPYYYWDKTGLTYTQDTQDEIILPDPQGGCDIKYRLNLKFHQEFYQSDTVTVCDAYQWPVVPGSNYTSTDHHIVKTFPGTGGSGFNCDSTYVLNLTINKSNNSEVTILNQCDQYVWNFGWNDEAYTLTEPGDYPKIIPTYQGCDSTVVMHLQLDYTPDFERVEGNPWVVGGSEFQYTIERYWIETHPQSTHETDWGLYYPNGEPFKKWDLFPYDNGDKCQLYIYTFERDSIELRAHTRSSGLCECGEFTHSKWIHCGYFDINENTSLCEADIFPNPNDGTMTLSFDNMMGYVDVKVYNITGTLVDQFNLFNGYGHQTHEYQSSHLSNGVYFFQFSSNEGKLTKKVVIFD